MVWPKLRTHQAYVKPWCLFLLFQKRLPNKYNFKLVCKICFRDARTQTEKPVETECCPTHDGKWIPLRLHTSWIEEIRPLPSVENPNTYKFNLCPYNQQGKCGRKEQCTWAHNQYELNVWKAEQAILHPRPCPPRPTIVPQLCGDLCTKQQCQRGQVCFCAHSEVELKIWQTSYQKTREDPKTRSELSKYHH